MDAKEVMAAVKNFRTQLKLTQTEFGNRLGKTLNTVLRYETIRPPTAPVLARLAELADSNGMTEYARLFRREMAQQLGISTEFIAVPPATKLRSAFRLFANQEQLVERFRALLLTDGGSIPEKKWARIQEEVDKYGTPIVAQIERLARDHFHEIIEMLNQQLSDVEICRRLGIEPPLPLSRMPIVIESSETQED